MQVVSNLDIFAKVGSNVPLVISDLKTCVDGDDGLSISFEGVTGSPLVSGIFIRRDSSGSKFSNFAFHCSGCFCIDDIYFFFVDFRFW